MSGKKLNGIKLEIVELIDQIRSGAIPADAGWTAIQRLKARYLEEWDGQSWNSFVGKRFEGLVHGLVKGYIQGTRKPKGFEVEVMTGNEVAKDEIVCRKLSVKYGKYLILPDIDSAIVLRCFSDPWRTKVVAVVSCKTSLRERIAQCVYWKVKFLSSVVLRDISVFLATADHEGHFLVKSRRRGYDGMSRNRVIAENELDGVYVMRDDLDCDSTSEKVKVFDQLFLDLAALVARS